MALVPLSPEKKKHDKRLGTDTKHENPEVNVADSADKSKVNLDHLNTHRVSDFAETGTATGRG